MHRQTNRMHGHFSILLESVKNEKKKIVNYPNFKVLDDLTVISELYFMFYFLAPGSYDVEKADKKIHESSPAYSLGVKYKEPKPEDIPGNFLELIVFIKRKSRSVIKRRLATLHK